MHEHGCHSAISKGEFTARFCQFLALFEGVDRQLSPEGTNLVSKGAYFDLPRALQLKVGVPGVESFKGKFSDHVGHSYSCRNLTSFVSISKYLRTI